MTVNQLVAIVDREKERQRIYGEELSKLAGLHKYVYSGWRNGRHVPTLKSFIAVLDVLGLELRIVRKKEVKE